MIVLLWYNDSAYCLFVFLYWIYLSNTFVHSYFASNPTTIIRCYWVSSWAVGVGLWQQTERYIQLIYQFIIHDAFNKAESYQTSWLIKDLLYHGWFIILWCVSNLSFLSSDFYGSLLSVGHSVWRNFAVEIYNLKGWIWKKNQKLMAISQDCCKRCHFYC